MADDEAEQEIRRTLDVVQPVIDISADRLEGLRTKCATSAEITQQEIRTLEGKLIKLFSRLLVAKTKLPIRDDLKHIPSLTQWLQVVGLSKESIAGVCLKVSSLEELKEKSEHELRTILNEKNAKPEEFGRLHRALHNLRRYTDILMRGGGDKQGADVDIPLYWDSWDHKHLRNNLSPRFTRTRPQRASVPSEDCNINCPSRGDGAASLAPSHSISSINSLVLYAPHSNINPITPPLTPPVVSKGKWASDKVKFPTTPPPKIKHLLPQTNVHLPDVYPLTKSKSHESQLAKNGDSDNSQSSQNEGHTHRGRLPTEPCYRDGYNSPQMPSPVKSPPYFQNTDSDDSRSQSLQVPKSPRTPVPRGMGHVIAHRFTKTFKMMTACNFCNRQMFGTGLKCKECKYKCHRECQNKVPPSCGLPQEFVNEFIKSFQPDGFHPNSSPNLPLRVSTSPNHNNLLIRHQQKRSHQHHGYQQSQQNQQLSNNQQFPGPDSSSNTSSCNSSTPSSPALLQPPTPHALFKQQFNFPEVHPIDRDVTIKTRALSPPQLIEPLLQDERTTCSSISTDSDRTPIRVDSQDSQVSDSETVIGDSHRWPRQNSLSMREWDIPFDELKIGEPIGTGRFGTVYRGNWHGDVAIKVLNMDYLDDEKTLETFRMEVGIFRKTRHENLMLFMGACMKPPRLAIVTSLSRGMTLYTHIHLRKDKINMNKTTIIAQQISQGMGYLHAKGIIHKDLKSKNIFLENGKVVIADFGLLSVTKLCFGNRKGDSLGIPPGWLCYLAPEIVRTLRAHQMHDEELPFSKTTDVYAFGTVWYELLCGEWPFKGQPPESIIWQVGKGMKQPLANLQASRDVKDILMQCWSFKAVDRPDFINLLTTLDKLPKKRLARSPSHPVHLSRSAESVF